MATTKTVASVDEWAAIAQNAVREGAVIDLSTVFGASLNINLAVSGTSAHTGTKIEIQVSSNSSGDEDWHTLASFIGGINAVPDEQALTDDPLAAASTTIAVASTAGRWDDDEIRWIFILDGTVANSEICLLVSHVANTSITILDGTTNEHAQNTNMYDTVDTWTYKLPFDAYRARVIYDNTYDPDGSQVHTSCRVTKTTAIA